MGGEVGELEDIKGEETGIRLYYVKKKIFLVRVEKVLLEDTTSCFLCVCGQVLCCLCVYMCV